MRRFIVPEVVQTSAMDCGPAALAALLSGYGLPVSYDRLREACQTDLDGTSIDTLEEVARDLGMDAEQIMLPVDHTLLAAAAALPAVAVVRLPSGLTHFVVIWRRHGDWIQIMDPATGRRWLRAERLEQELYLHTVQVPASAWREWAGSDDFLSPLRHRLRALGAGSRSESLLGEACADPHWRSLAALDAATRMVQALISAGGVGRGAAAGAMLDLLFRDSVRTPDTAPDIIPRSYWSARPPAGGDAAEPCIELRGAVLVRIRQREDPLNAADSTPMTAPALAPRGQSPWNELWQLLQDSRQSVLLASLAVAALTVTVEALLLRGVLGLGGRLGPFEQRAGMWSVVLLFFMAVLLVELGVSGLLLRAGRRLEVHFRAATLSKIPRIQERYFGTRPVSDMAERAHAVHQVRLLPRLCGHLLRVVFQVLLTAVALLWLFPQGLLLVLWGVVAAIGIPLLIKPVLEEQDLRIRTQAGSLGRFYLDALLGLVAIRAHSGETAMRREHEALLVEWGRASTQRLRYQALLDGGQATLGFAFAILLLFQYSGSQSSGGSLLLAYWALMLPVLGEEATMLIRRLALQRSVSVRLLEPLAAAEHEVSHRNARAVSTRSGGAAVGLRDVTVRAGGHVILEGITFDLRPGEHVAVVGRSGAGKSTLAAAMLGMHPLTEGHVAIGGRRADAAGLQQLREDTAWIDPSIQLWNRSLLDNVAYGHDPATFGSLPTTLEQTGLLEVVRRLPSGLQTRLGEGGGLLSGGEGQRVRIGRAVMRADARVAILDEAFRGLDRQQRRFLLGRCRTIWSRSTFIYITHDLESTLDFGRIIVLEDGRIVEDGDPASLVREEGGHFASLLAAERRAALEVWGYAGWRRLRVEDGRIRSSDIAG